MAIADRQDGSPQFGLPERHLCQDDRSVLIDDGFLNTTESRGLVPLSALFEHWCSLVLAPPWMGKTFVSEAIEKALQTGSLVEPGGCQLSPVHRTCFESAGAHSEVPPPWWESWKHSDKTACWVIDAIDEGQHRQPGTGIRLAKILEDLDERERGRLRVLMFSRQRGLPEDLPDRLKALRVHSPSLQRAGLTQYQFGPLTREEAGRIAGGEHALERVIQIIREHELQEEARYPKVLQHLAKLPVGATVTTESIWRSLLMELLTEPNPNRVKPSESQPEERLAAAAHIAAVLTLTGEEEFSCEGSSLHGLCLNEVVPYSDERGKPSRRAAQEALDSDLFHRTATGYRFAQRNIQEKLCAFGLSRLRLSALRPMMADSQGRPFSVHIEALAFLGAISEHGEVRKWVAENTSLLESDAPCSGPADCPARCSASERGPGAA